MDTPKNMHLGSLCEQQACDFLQHQGLKLITRNYRCSHGEIDLIMQQDKEIIFIEVRMRTHSNYGTAIESIDRIKQQKLLKSATHYLQNKNWLDKVDCRFDVIGFSNTTSIEWIKDAFSYE